MSAVAGGLAGVSDKVDVLEQKAWPIGESTSWGRLSSRGEGTHPVQDLVSWSRAQVHLGCQGPKGAVWLTPENGVCPHSPASSPSPFAPSGTSDLPACRGPCLPLASWRQGLGSPGLEAADSSETASHFPSPGRGEGRAESQLCLP